MAYKLGDWIHHGEVESWRYIYFEKRIDFEQYLIEADFLPDEYEIYIGKNQITRSFKHKDNMFEFLNKLWFDPYKACLYNFYDSGDRREKYALKIYLKHWNSR